MGDMNYRMNTRFACFNNDNVSETALELLPALDQLGIAMKPGDDNNYPGY